MGAHVDPLPTYLAPTLDILDQAERGVLPERLSSISIAFLRWPGDGEETARLAMKLALNGVKAYPLLTNWVLEGVEVVGERRMKAYEAFYFSPDEAEDFLKSNDDWPLPAECPLSRWLSREDSCAPHASSSVKGGSGRRTRSDTLALAINAAWAKLTRELSRPPRFGELWKYLVERDATGIVKGLDSSGNLLYEADHKDEDCAITRKNVWRRWDRRIKLVGRTDQPSSG